jgi:tetratricopeptide (TPR) repeat protein
MSPPEVPTKRKLILLALGLPLGLLISGIVFAVIIYTMSENGLLAGAGFLGWLIIIYIILDRALSLSANLSQVTGYNLKDLWTRREETHQTGVPVSTLPISSTFATTAIFAQTPDAVPEQPRKLIGRDDLLAQVHAALDRGEHVLLQGFGGMGKTALAATVAVERIENGKGPSLWLKAGNAEADSLFEALARPFNAQQTVASATGEAKIVLMRDMLAEKGLKLLVLDDAWNGEVLNTIMRAVPRSLPVLVTSRHRYPIDNVVEVEELTPDAALKLLEFYAYQTYVGTRFFASANDLCHKLGYHAYALEIAGKTLYVDNITPADLLKRIEDAPHDMAMPGELAAARRQSIGDLIEVSLNAVKEMNEVACNVFLAFGAFFAPSATPELLALFFRGTPEISDEMLEVARERVPDELKEASDDQLRQFLQGMVLEPLDPAPIQSVLTILVRRGLAQRITETENSIAYYRVHDLAHSYARAQNTDDHLHRALDACIAYTWQYNQPSLENFAALRPELANFMAAANWAFIVERYEAAERFAWNLYRGSEILDLQGYYAQAVELLAQAARAAEKQNNRRNQGTHLGNLGNAYNSLGQYQQAFEYHQQALAISREIGDRRGEGTHLGNLGIAYHNLGEYQRAIEYHQQALTISREIADKRSEGTHLGNLGNTYHNLGEYQRAIEYHQQALTISREIADKRSEGSHLSNLGNAYLSLGQYPRAIEYYQQALTISREIGDRGGEGNHLGNLGSAYYNLGEYQRAIEYHEQALVIKREIGDKRGEGNALGNLGNAYADLGQVEQAIEHYQQALSISREIGDKLGEGNRLGNLGVAYADLGQYQWAINHYEQARTIYEAIGVMHEVKRVDKLIARARAAQSGVPGSREAGE